MKTLSLSELKTLSLNELPHIEDVICFVIHGAESKLIKLELSRLVGNSSGEFLKGPDGKPSFADSTYQFNLSHSGDYTAVALHPNDELGIDIETWKPKSRLDPIAKRYFTEEENRVLQALEGIASESKALHFWTIKEAVTKLYGGTLFQGISKVEAIPLPAEIKFYFEVEEVYSMSLAMKAPPEMGP